MRALGIFLLCWASSALAGTTDDAIPDARYVENGRRFASWAARIDTLRADGTRPSGSCVVIADRWVLTAAHVLEGYRSGEVTAAAGTRRITAIRRPREWDIDRTGWHDIALVRVAEPWGLARYPALSEGDEQPGDVVTIAGYGLTGRLSTGWESSDQQLRAGTATIDRFEAAVLVCPARSVGTPLPFCTAPGDSGGPVFIGERLVGIASFVQKTTDGTRTRSKAGEESCHTRVSLYREWITGVIAEDLTAAVASVHGTDLQR